MNRQIVAERFRIIGPIGRGNMGEVHRAEDTRPRKDPRVTDDDPAPLVAVKLLLRRRSGAPIDPQSPSVKRFGREVRIMERLTHPRIPAVIDGGVDTTDGDHLPYLAMEFLDGYTLDDLSKDVPQLPVSWAAAIGAQIADALYAAHAAEVVHRDLKPANVMLTRGGLVKVLDFGMGLIVDDPDLTKLTSTDTTVGTARYMAPEQFQGATVTRAADLYALGCVLYELLTGGPPFEGPPSSPSVTNTITTIPPLGLMRAIPGRAQPPRRATPKKPEDRPPRSRGPPGPDPWSTRGQVPAGSVDPANLPVSSRRSRHTVAHPRAPWGSWTCSPSTTNSSRSIAPSPGRRRHPRRA